MDHQAPNGGEVHGQDTQISDGSDRNAHNQPAVTVQGSATTAHEAKAKNHHPKPKPKPKGLKCAKTHAYPGHQSSDCVAVNGVVAIANTTVTATWSKSTVTSVMSPSICAAITIKNHNSSTISYNDLYWSLQTPSGEVINTNFEGSPDLGSGSIVGGGTATGNVCFDDPGQSDTYVGIYKPDPFNSDRGIWLFPAT
jgi:hypothetical protein